MWAVIAAIALVLGWPVCMFLVMMVRLYCTMKVLNRMPHVKAPGILGWAEVGLDQEHAPHILAKAAEELGGIYSFRVAHLAGVVVTDPALTQQLLCKLDLPKERRIYHIFNCLTSPDGRQPNLLGHFAHEGYWRLVRKGTAPAFSPKHIRGEFPHVVELTHQICAILSSAGPATYLDVDNLLQRESMDVIGRIGFATDFGAIKGFKAPVQHSGDSGGLGGKGSGAGEGGAGSGLPPAHYASTVLNPDDVFDVVKGAAAELVRRWTDPWRMYLRHITPDGRRGECFLRAYQSHMWRLMKEIRARGEPEPDDMSVAAHLLRIRDPQTGRPLTDEQLASEIGVFFFAGFETTGHTMAWTLYFLASHPDVEGKVCAELDALGLLVTRSRPSPRPLAYDDLGKLKYLGCAIKEAMRLVPVVGGGSPRMSDKALQLGGYDIPAGVQITAPLQGIMTSSRNWERPQDYWPERWEVPGAEYWHGPVRSAEALSGSGKKGVAANDCAQPLGPAAPAATGGEYGILEEEEDDSSRAGEGARPPLRFIPFSAGLRSCVGQNLAKMNYTATLAILLSRFTFELPQELRGPGAFYGLQCFRTTTQPAKGLPLRSMPRPV